jgi:20S proteasome alpha/beta subunit
MSASFTSRRILDSAVLDKIATVALQFFVKEFDDVLSEGETLLELVVDQFNDGFELEPNSGEEVVEVVIFTENYTFAMLVNREFNVIESMFEEVDYDC